MKSELAKLRESLEKGDDLDAAQLTLFQSVTGRDYLDTDIDSDTGLTLLLSGVSMPGSSLVGLRINGELFEYDSFEGALQCLTESAEAMDPDYISDAPPRLGWLH